MYGPLNTEEASLIARLPIINRARGARLYTAEGSRWLDCWADGGRALIGHRPGGVSLRLKNEINRGLYAPYPNRWDKRLAAALLKLFPGYKTVRIFRNMERAAALSSRKKHPIDPLDLPVETRTIADPIWGRPLLPNHPGSSILFPILPVPGIIEAQTVLYTGEFDDQLPLNDPVSPLILAALTRSCSALGGSTCIDRGEDSEYWAMRGPYMVYRGDEKDYRKIFEILFNRAVLIAPSPHRPSIYPGDISEGEKKLLRIPSK